MECGSFAVATARGLTAEERLILHSRQPSLTVCETAPGDQDILDSCAEVYVLENSYVKVTVSSTGAISSFLDKRIVPHREIIDTKGYGKKGSHGCGNSLVLYDDIPLFWDAWDIMPYCQYTGRCINECVTSGRPDGVVPSAPEASDQWRSRVISRTSSMHMVSITIETIKGISFTATDCTRIEQCILLRSDSAMLDFHTTIDWHESHALLKVEFPLAIRTPSVQYEMQNALIARPTHKNNSTDAAMFECCAHKFADMSEPGYGVALLNTSKYGYSCQGTVHYVWFS